MIIALVRRTLASVAFAATLSASPCAASERGYDVWFAGQVLAVDAHHERLRIARGPTETAGRGIEECVVVGAALKQLRPGMLIEAQADTRRRPWRILHLRVMLERTRTHLDGPTLATVT
ncbi:MAG TPA: hypothetical protein VK669_08580 [Candidatus Limnocylindrales bacterium]|nr:hypothetical protein [Candidatus Limnocylindrales bacterium]